MSVAELVRERVHSVPEGEFIHSRDLVEEIGSRAGVDVALHRLRESEHLVPVRRGIYFKARPTRFGLTRPDALRVGYEVAKAAGHTAGVGPAGYTAARALGLTTQVPAWDELSVPGRAPAALPEVRFASRSAVARTKLRPLEVAVLELLPHWPRYTEVSWAGFVKTVAGLVERGKVDTEAICSVARRERHLEARARAERLHSEVTDIA